MRKKIVTILLILSLVFCMTACIKSLDSAEKELAKEEGGIGYVYVTIECSSILKNYDKLDPALKSEKYVPASGIILNRTKVLIKANETVFDALKRVTSKEKIHLDFNGSDDKVFNTIYIKGINNVYEFSCGNLSGWTFKVNKEYANVGCGSYKVNDLDEIVWSYTCDLGNDVRS